MIAKEGRGMEETEVTLLEVEDLNITFINKRQVTRAVEGINFTVKKKEIMAIVGESGSGKSVTALSILGILPSNKNCQVTGRVLFKGQDLLSRKTPNRKGLNTDEIAMIFQDPIQSLNPVFTVGYQIAEVFRLKEKMSKKEAWREAIKLLGQVGIKNPEQASKQYPHQFSGGMCQRVMIAMALAKKPKLLIADEPTTALDVTIQYQILKLLEDLHQKMDMSILFITHDLGLVAQFCHRLAVVHEGEVVEVGPVDPIFSQPLHPYTRGLLKSIPVIGRKERLEALPTNFDALDQGQGCKFYKRCKERCDLCLAGRPAMEQHGPDHYVRCLFKGV
jgi:peptide/nickel transport system ATP-binding protein/oligopeptide transport system ATP-binding protein